MSRAEDAFALVAERGEMRSSAIAELLDCTAANVHELLLPYVQRGELVSCDVEVRGERLKDYRVSAAGGGKPQVFTPYRSKPEQKKPPTFPAAAAAPAQPAKKEEPQMSSSDQKILAALKKHGPMKGAQIRERVKHIHLAKAMPRLMKGELVILLTDVPDPVYGLPGQTLPKDTDKPTPAPKLKKPAAGKAAKKKSRVQVMARRGRAYATSLVNAAIAARAAARAVQPGAFRPAITHDGALLLTGAAREGELNSGEVRVLAGFLRRLDETGARA